MGSESIWVPLLLGAGAGYGASEIFGGKGGGVDLPSTQAGNLKKTAEPVEQLSEQAKKNRRKAASMLPRGFEPPKLSTPGMLGL